MSDYIRNPDIRFKYPGDPRDEKLIELAIALRGSHIISGDNDLLSLPGNKNESGKRFRQRLPNTAVLSAHEFLQWHGLAGSVMLSDSFPNIRVVGGSIKSVRAWGRNGVCPDFWGASLVV